MNKQTEALKMAIEALESAYGVLECESMIPIGYESAIQACKEALEQPMINGLTEQETNQTMSVKGLSEQPAQEYLTRAQQVIRANNSAQEPVAWVGSLNEFDMRRLLNEGYELSTALYTHPAPSWQGLSDDEIFDLHHKWIMNSGNKDTQYDFARAIEQALRERNCNDTK